MGKREEDTLPCVGVMWIASASAYSVGLKCWVEGRLAGAEVGRAAPDRTEAGRAVRMAADAPGD